MGIDQEAPGGVGVGYLIPGLNHFSVVCLTAPAERCVHPPGAPRTNEGPRVGAGYLIPGLGRFIVACLTALAERLVHSPGSLRTYEETGAHMCGKTPGHSGRSGTHRLRRLRHWLEETREILTTSGASRLRSREKITGARSFVRSLVRRSFVRSVVCWLFLSNTR